MSTSKDGKEIVNMFYHAGVQTLLTVGYAEIGKRIFKRSAPKVDLNIGDIAMLTIDIYLAMLTKDMLVKNKIIPENIMN